MEITSHICNKYLISPTYFYCCLKTSEDIHLAVTVSMLERISSNFLFVCFGRGGLVLITIPTKALSPLIATETSDTEITTTEIIKRRDVGPYGIRSEYCIRKIICPLGVPETPKGKLRFLFYSFTRFLHSRLARS